MVLDYFDKQGGQLPDAFDSVATEESWNEALEWRLQHRWHLRMPTIKSASQRPKPSGSDMIYSSVSSKAIPRARNNMIQFFCILMTRGADRAWCILPNGNGVFYRMRMVYFTECPRIAIVSLQYPWRSS
jgi:hypothetical protein